MPQSVRPGCYLALQASMQTLTTLSELRQARAALTGTLGLVPTRGGLHAGKLSLVARARAECAGVAVSLLPSETSTSDDLAHDLALLAPLAVDLVWAPAYSTLYPPDFQTWVLVEQVAAPLEGKHRPGHFRAVATETTRLFNALAPSRAYYGQLDAQQLAVVRRLVRDLDYAVQIVDCPTVREPDGLALNRRNAGLSAPQRRAATVLYRASRPAARPTLPVNAMATRCGPFCPPHWPLSPWRARSTSRWPSRTAWTSSNKQHRARCCRLRPELAEYDSSTACHSTENQLIRENWKIETRCC